MTLARWYHWQVLNRAVAESDSGSNRVPLAAVLRMMKEAKTETGRPVRSSLYNQAGER